MHFVLQLIRRAFWQTVRCHWKGSECWVRVRERIIFHVRVLMVRVIIRVRIKVKKGQGKRVRKGQVQGYARGLGVKVGLQG